MRRSRRHSQARTVGATPKYYGYMFLDRALCPTATGGEGGFRSNWVSEMADFEASVAVGEFPPCGKAVRQKRFASGVENTP
jgi:hypothetical protein